MRKVVIGTLAAALLGGCMDMNRVAPPASTATAYAGKPLTAAIHETPQFLLLTWTPPDFITADNGVRSRWADDMIQANEIKDPVLAIAAKLTPAVSQRLGTSETRTVGDVKDGSEKALSGIAGGQGVVLHVETRGWQVVYYPLDWTHYRTMYRGRAILVDGATGELLAQVSCAWDSSDKNPPTRHEIFADRAALLKSHLAQATESCAATYEKGLRPD